MKIHIIRSRCPRGYLKKKSQLKIKVKKTRGMLALRIIRTNPHRSRILITIQMENIMWWRNWISTNQWVQVMLSSLCPISKLSVLHNKSSVLEGSTMKLMKIFKIQEISITLGSKERIQQSQKCSKVALVVSILIYFNILIYNKSNRKLAKLLRDIKWMRT